MNSNSKNSNPENEMKTTNDDNNRITGATKKKDAKEKVQGKREIGKL